MQTYPIKQYTFKIDYFLNLLIGIVLFIVSSICFAGNVVITGNQIIDKPTTYNNVVLDMTNGRFTIKTGGSLNIVNSTINSTITASNPFAILETDGSLTLTNNTVNVSSSSITPNPNVKAANQFIQVQKGVAVIGNNMFTNDTAFTLGFFDASTTTTYGFDINNNTISNFHGGINLVNSNNANINDNTFNNVSFTSIFNMGNFNRILRNLFSFPGNLVMGDAIDIVNSSGLNVTDNIIASSAGYGIYINGGQNLFIENNKITDGMSYAIFIDTPSHLTKNKLVSQFMSRNKIKAMTNSTIAINQNYMAQNRYGVAGGVVDHLIVTNNFFIQRFTDNSTRQYWTNNEVLLPLANDLVWLDNLYKEAFTQEVPGDNTNTLQFVPFPKTGGVFLP